MNKLIETGIFEKSKVFLNFWRGDICKYGHRFLVKFEIECSQSDKIPVLDKYRYVESTEKCLIFAKIKSKYGN